MYNTKPMAKEAIMGATGIGFTKDPLWIEQLASSGDGTFKPAEGKEKERLTAECQEYLQNPDKKSGRDIADFVENMIHLTGGKITIVDDEDTKRAYHNKWGDSGYSCEKARKLESPPINDKQSQTTFSLTQIQPRSQVYSTTKTTISSTFNVDPGVKIQEDLRIGKHLTAIVFGLSGHVDFHSQTTNEQEQVDLRPTKEKPVKEEKVKALAQRVWNAYEKQEQRSQLPAPQN